MVVYAALHGVNIPGGTWLTEADVRAALQRQQALTYLRIIGRPDSILLAADDAATEDQVRCAVTAAVGCRCVVITADCASRIVSSAFTVLRALGPPTPPYRITTEGAAWEWCLVLSSDALPAGVPDNAWLFERTPAAVAVAPLEGRALLVRKRRFTANGTRITLGDRLLVPWQRVLDVHRVTVSCLTSRTLNRVAQAVSAATCFARV